MDIKHIIPAFLIKMHLRMIFPNLATLLTMKEQGQEFDPSKEPVRKDTIGRIFEECRILFGASDNDREGYTSDGREIRITTANHAVLARHEYGKYYVNVSHNADADDVVVDQDFNMMDFNFDKTLDFNRRKLARYDIAFVDRSAGLSYTYALSYGMRRNFGNPTRKDREENVFLLLFLTPRATHKSWWDMEDTLGSLAKEEAKKLFSGGAKVGRLIYEYYSWNPRPLPDSPLYDVIKPSEQIAQHLLNELKSTKFRTIPNYPEF